MSASRDFPTPLAVVDLPGAGGVALRVRRHGNLKGPRLLVSHGNGFAVDGYFAFWRRFLAAFEVVVFDARQHGQNPPGEPANHDYAHLARDLERVRQGSAEAFGSKPCAGLFHSMSAQAAMLAALDDGFRFEALVLFDPPNTPPPGHPVHPPMVAYLRALFAWAARRRAHFADPTELARDYAATGAGRDWVAGAHLRMAEAVLLPSPGGGWDLRCPPALEAAIYDAGITLPLWPKRRAFAGPVKLIGADPLRPRPTRTALSNQALAQEGGYDYLALPGAGHLLQLEQPAACADAALEFLRRIGFAR